VNWPTFIQGFSAALKQQYSVVVTEEDENFLRKILGNFHVSSSLHHFRRQIYLLLY
jgi:hypothetical protein